jgi:hypothetical protein
VINEGRVHGRSCSVLSVRGWCKGGNAADEHLRRGRDSARRCRCGDVHARAVIQPLVVEGHTVSNFAGFRRVLTLDPRLLHCLEEDAARRLRMKAVILVDCD